MTTQKLLPALVAAKTEHDVSQFVFEESHRIGLSYELQQLGYDMEAVAKWFDKTARDLYHRINEAKTEMKKEDILHSHSAYAEMAQITEEAAVRIREIKSGSSQARA